MANKIVEEKIQNIGVETAKFFSGNKVLEEAVKAEVRSIINEDQIKTSREEIDDLAKIISEKLGIENNSEVKIEAKKIRIEVKKWTEKNKGEVFNYKKEEFNKKLEEETKKLNPDIKPEELAKVKELGNLVAENQIEKSVIDNQKDAALEFNKPLFSPGKLENAWTDLKGTVNFLQKTPEQISEIKNKYSSIKDQLKNVQIPTNLKEIRSFDGIVANLGNNKGNDLFSKTQKYLGWADRVDKLTGGWLNRTVSEAGLKIAGKIGNQAIQEFATNALGTMAKEGFQAGFKSVLNGVLSGGVKAAATTAAGGAATGAAAAGGAAATGATVAAGAAASATGVGAIVVAALAVLKKVKDIGNKIAEKLGISIKGFLEEKFGKVGGKVVSGLVSLVALPTLLLGSISMAFLGPALLIGGGGFFGYQMMQQNLVSSLNPPKGARNTTETPVNEGGGWDGVSCVNYNSNYPTTVETKTGINGLTLYLFETSGGKVMQLYDLGCIDSQYLVNVDMKYSNTAGNKLDSRVLPAFIAMYEAGQRAGLSPYELQLTSGYRSNQEEADVREWWRGIIENGINNGSYSGSSPAWNCEVYRDAYYDNLSLKEKIEKCLNQYTVLPGNSNHLTGRVADISVNTDAAYNWLQENAASYGFVYNYPLERWHWEYNPAP